MLHFVSDLYYFVFQVQAQIPIEEEDITAFYRSRGWLADYLQIDPSTLKKGRKVKLQSNSKYQGTLASIVTAKLDEKTFEDEVVQEVIKESTMTNTQDNKEVPNFSEMKKKYVHPFNQAPKTTPARMVPSEFQRESTPKRPAYSARKARKVSPKSADKARRFAERYARKPYAGKKQDPQSQQGPQDPANGQARDIMVVEEAEEEMALKSFDTTDHLISSIQKAFVSKFSFEVVQHRFSQLSLENLKSELTCLQLTELVRYVAEYLYWTYLGEKVHTIRQQRGVEGNTSVIDINKYQRQYFLAIHQNVSKVENRIEKKTGQMMLYMPLIFLMIRVSIEAIFRRNFPKWIKLQHGKALLQMMDETVVNIIDPDKYMLHISLIESTSEAIRISSKPQRHHESILQKFYATSPLVRCLFPSYETRPIHIPQYARKSEGGEWLPSFSGDEKEKKLLYQLARQRIRLPGDGPTVNIDTPSILLRQSRSEVSADLQSHLTLEQTGPENKTDLPRIKGTKGSGYDLRATAMNHSLSQLTPKRGNFSGDLPTTPNLKHGSPGDLTSNSKMADLQSSISQISASAPKPRLIEFNVSEEKTPEMLAEEAAIKEQEELDQIVESIIIDLPQRVAEHTSRSPSPTQHNPKRFSEKL
eukprot:TRINITY_DN11504_c0_g1_i2.p1 TRINITY_DN11504_c0_g1~~TRINITY_DN11504_c0_g1_i2.p1  ORF type:complete len:643 (+),score=127.95 TRINITY_DN11504_c0_g1_i2:663-2591(+)